MVRRGTLMVRSTATPCVSNHEAVNAWLKFDPTGKRASLMLALEPADVLLGVKLQPDPPDQVELGFEEVDVVFLVLHQAFEQVARHIVLDLMAIGRRFLIQ